MRVAIIFTLVSVVAVCLVVTKAEQVERTLQSNDKGDEDVGRILRSSDRGTANSGGKLASWSKADPESDVLRPANKNREGREGRKGKKGLLGKVRGGGKDRGEVEEEGEGGENGRRLVEESADARSEAEQKRTDMERRREELRQQKQKEIRDRYKNRDTGDFDPERYMRERDGRWAGRGGDMGALEEEDYLSERHQELRDRHRSHRERASSRDRSGSSGSSGRRDRKRPESEGRHAVLRRRIDKHAHLFSPEELAEIEDDLRQHKKREDKLDAARDKLNAQFDAVRDIDDRDARLGRLEQLKQQRAAGRDAERAARDQLREDFQLIREKLEAKLRTELR